MENIQIKSSSNETPLDGIKTDYDSYLKLSKI